jgi:hypothetical protein
MGFLRTLRKFGSAAFRAAAVLYVAFLLCGTVEICLCDPDPDNCGEHCHDCEDHAADECRHLTVDVGDYFVSQTAVSIPSVFAAVYPFPVSANLELSFRPRLRPVSTAPPDNSTGNFLFYSTRIHPLA